MRGTGGTTSSEGARESGGDHRRLEKAIWGRRVIVDEEHYGRLARHVSFPVMTIDLIAWRWWRLSDG